MKYYISQVPANPITRIVAAIVATVSLAAAFFFGLVILAVIAVAIALLSLVFWLRMKWLGRNAPQPQVHTRDRAGSQAGSQDYIEAEYTVISKRRD